MYHDNNTLFKEAASCQQASDIFGDSQLIITGLYVCNYTKCLFISGYVWLLLAHNISLSVGLSVWYMSVCKYK